MDSPFEFTPDLNKLLLDNKLARFGDSIVNFIYNAAVYEATKELKGVKVWDQCLAQACRNSPLRKFAGSRKNAGDLGDAVEAFIAIIYLKNPEKISDMISIISKSITVNYHLSELSEKELCSKVFTVLLNELCKDFGIIE